MGSKLDHFIAKYSHAGIRWLDMADSRVKKDLFEKKREKKKTEAEEGKKTEKENPHLTPERRNISFAAEDAEMVEKEDEAEATKKQISTKRIWSKK